MHAIIETDVDLRRGVKALVAVCPGMQRAYDVVGMPPLRRHVDGLPGLARVIVGQQLSVASAAAIWQRLDALVSPFDVETLNRLDDAELRGAGLSASKVRTLRGLAAALEAGLDLARVGEMPVEQAHEVLTALPGIGPWTADIYLMFCVGRADAWAPGDLALQIGAQMALGLDERPTAKALTELAERWRPWRAVAAGLLWAYYGHVKRVKLAAPV